MITIQTFYIDGSTSEHTTDASIIEKLIYLKNLGYGGKELVHHLLTDDFGAPPISFNISGKLKNGTEIIETIYYR